MPGALALVLAAVLSSLPPLPQRGLALETQGGVQLQTMAGQPLASLAGMDLAFDQAVAHKLVVPDEQGRAAARPTDAAPRAVPDVGRLALLLVVRAGVHGTVELVV
jgi:hypothetical protein